MPTPLAAWASPSWRRAAPRPDPASGLARAGRVARRGRLLGAGLARLEQLEGGEEERPVAGVELAAQLFEAAGLLLEAVALLPRCRDDLIGARLRVYGSVAEVGLELADPLAGRDRVYGYCLHELGSREEAEDVLQDTYLNAWRSLQQGVRPQTPLPWLLRIAKNLCISRYRAAAARVQTRPFDGAEPLPAGPAPRTDELFALSSALAELPETQRRAFVMREWRGLSLDEIAEELHLSYSAVATHVFRGRRTLAAALAQRLGGARDRLGSFAFALLGSLKSLLAGGIGANLATGAAVMATAGAIVAPALDQRPEREGPMVTVPPAAFSEPAAGGTDSSAAPAVEGSEVAAAAGTPEHRRLDIAAAPVHIGPPAGGTSAPAAAVPPADATPANPPSLQEQGPATSAPTAHAHGTIGAGGAGHPSGVGASPDAGAPPGAAPGQETLPAQGAGHCNGLAKGHDKEHGQGLAQGHDDQAGNAAPPGQEPPGSPGNGNGNGLALGQGNGLALGNGNGLALGRGDGPAAGAGSGAAAHGQGADPGEGTAPGRGTARLRAPGPARARARGQR